MGRINTFFIWGGAPEYQSLYQNSGEHKSDQPIYEEYTEGRVQHVALLLMPRVVCEWYVGLRNFLSNHSHVFFSILIGQKQVSVANLVKVMVLIG